MNTPPAGWVVLDKALKKTFVFASFREAMHFVNRVARLAEEANHHPDIRIFSYKNVEIMLTTHDAGGSTEKDVELAERIENL